MAIDYQIDSKSMGNFVKSAVLGQAMLEVAQDGVTYAKTIAPVMSGGYRDSIKAEQVMVPVGKKNEMRAGAMVYTDSPYNAVVENKHHVMSRTADYMSGGKLS